MRSFYSLYHVGRVQVFAVEGETQPTVVVEGILRAQVVLVGPKMGQQVLHKIVQGGLGSFWGGGPRKMLRVNFTNSGYAVAADAFHPRSCICKRGAGRRGQMFRGKSFAVVRVVVPFSAQRFAGGVQQYPKVYPGFPVKGLHEVLFLAGEMTFQGPTVAEKMTGGVRRRSKSAAELLVHPVFVRF